MNELMKNRTLKDKFDLFVDFVTLSFFLLNVKRVTLWIREKKKLLLFFYTVIQNETHASL